jgi:putative folate metabolism gamma-glutamate ligase
MNVTPIKTKKIFPDDDFFSHLFSSLPFLQEKQLLVISSKILSLCYGYFVKKETSSKESLIEQEADIFWPSERGGPTQLTIKENCFLPFSGIDESNSAGTYVLFPKNLFLHATSIWEKLRSHYNIEKLGVLIIDSQIIPLRKGTLGLGLSWCGFHPLYSYSGEKDCFDRPYTLTNINLVDAYATASILEMGEGNEQCPLALIDEAPKIHFMNRPPNEEEQKLVTINPEEDLFSPLLNGGYFQSK